MSPAGPSSGEQAAAAPAARRDEPDAAKCPVDHTKLKDIPKDHPFYQHMQDMKAKMAAKAEPEAEEKINPLNMMPDLPQTQHPTQKIALPTERTMSTIPKSNTADMDEERYGAKDEKVWAYPSPQQFYVSAAAFSFSSFYSCSISNLMDCLSQNALKRKGWETPEQHVPVMVDIHNFLNEACWQEILKWEKMHEWCVGEMLVRLFSAGRHLTALPRDQRLCQPHAAQVPGQAQRPFAPCPYDDYFLRVSLTAGYVISILIIAFNLSAPKPFDRHDWYVDRCGQTVRYVIDYYSGGEDVPGQPVFNVDVRPALDSVGAASDRLKVAFGGIYDGFRAKWSGAASK